MSKKRWSVAAAKTIAAIWELLAPSLTAVTIHLSAACASRDSMNCLNQHLRVDKSGQGCGRADILKRGGIEA
jgi:hypothetical protein